MKAPIWRALMAIGMKFHHFADPKPPRPSFKIVIPSRLSPRGGTFKLVFYCPESYLQEPEDEDFRYPVVVNFHGGGFTLGTGTDDARWAASVVEHAEAILVSVEYRLAPEYPFSVGVEDGTDALIYLASHAEELRLDPHRIALSGFSAGGNFAFTIPLMLYDLQHEAGKRTLSQASSTIDLSRPSSSHTPYPNPSSLSLPPRHHGSSTLSLPHARPIASHISSTSSILKLSNLEPTALEISQTLPAMTIKCIVSFYPPTDFRIPRKEKRNTNPNPKMNLPVALTNLFDESYLHIRPSSPTKDSQNGSGSDRAFDRSVSFSDPYLSPAAASDQFLNQAYPEDIVMYTCEHDMLCSEGISFGNRLSSPPINKKLHGGMIKGVPHAFDKKPNPLRFPEAADRCYKEACAELKTVFGGRVGRGERRVLERSLRVERFEGEEVGDVVLGQGEERARQGEPGRARPRENGEQRAGGREEEEDSDISEDEGLRMISRSDRRNTIAMYRDRWKCNQAQALQQARTDAGSEGERERLTGEDRGGEGLRYEERVFPP